MTWQVVQIEAPAKINLYLDVLGKRSDGYHEIESVMQSISLCDRLTIIPEPEQKMGKVELVIKNTEESRELKSFPQGDANLINQAVNLLAQTVEFPGIKVVLEKNIPMQAGLAGGSADAAAVLIGVNELFNLGFSKQNLAQIGAQLGSDIPFCIYGGTMLATGRGEQLQSLTAMPNCYLVAVKPAFGVDTAKVYKALQKDFLDTDRPRSRSEKIISSLERGTLNEIVENMYNNMEGVVFNWHNELSNISDKLSSLGALKVMMSGSGSTVFGVYNHYQTALQAVHKLKCEWDSVYLSIPSQLGVRKENS